MWWISLEDPQGSADTRHQETYYITKCRPSLSLKLEERMNGYATTMALAYYVVVLSKVALLLHQIQPKQECIELIEEV